MIAYFSRHEKAEIANVGHYNRGLDPQRCRSSPRALFQADGHHLAILAVPTLGRQYASKKTR